MQQIVDDLGAEELLSLGGGYDRVDDLFLPTGLGEKTMDAVFQHPKDALFFIIRRNDQNTGLGNPGFDIPDGLVIETIRLIIVHDNDIRRFMLFEQSHQFLLITCFSDNSYIVYTPQHLLQSGSNQMLFVSQNYRDLFHG